MLSSAPTFLATGPVARTGCARSDFDILRRLQAADMLQEFETSHGRVHTMVRRTTADVVTGLPTRIVTSSGPSTREIHG